MAKKKKTKKGHAERTPTQDVEPQAQPLEEDGAPEPDDEHPATGREGLPAPVAFLPLMRESWKLVRPHILALTLVFGLVFSVFPLVPTIVINVVGIPEGGYAPLLLVCQTGLVVLSSVLFGRAAVTMTESLVGRSRAEGKAPRVGMRLLLPVGVVAAGLTLFALFLGPLLAFVQPVILAGGLIALPLVMGPVVLVQVTALEGKHLAEAWSRTRLLAAGQWGRVIVYMLALSVSIGALALIAVRLVLAAAEGLAAWAILASIVAAEAVVVGFAMAFLSAVQLGIYLDLRARAEDLTLAELRREREEPLAAG